MEEKPKIELRIRQLLLAILFCSIPISIAGGDFSIIFLYFVSLYIWVKSGRKIEYSVLFWGMGLFFSGAILSSLTSEQPLHSFSYFRNFWRFALPFLIYFTFLSVNFRKHLNILFVVSAMIAIYSIPQFLTGLDIFRSSGLSDEYRPEGGVWLAVGAFSHHLTFGGVMLMIFPMALAMAIPRSLPKSHRCFYGATALFCLIAILLSMGRSTWLGAAVVIILIFFILSGWKKSLIFMITLGIIITTFWNTTLREDLLKDTAIGKRFSAGLSLASNRDRLLMWTAGVRVIKDHPILGLGPKSGEQILPYYTELAKENNHRYDHHPDTGLHNIYIQTWIDFGLLGLAGYLLWWGTLIVGGFSRIRDRAFFHNPDSALLLGLSTGLVGVMVAGFFENNFRDGEVQTAILTAMGLMLVLFKKLDKAAKTTS